MNIQLNPEQQQFYDDIYPYLNGDYSTIPEGVEGHPNGFVKYDPNNPDNSIYKNNIKIVRAPAGTGKSFIMKHLSRTFPGQCEILAPTRKVAMNNRGRTIASFFNGRPHYDENGVEVWDYRLDVGRARNRIILIDECSMLSEKQFELIKICVDNTAFVILFGDDKQLPPVGEVSSVCFEMGLDTWTFTRNMRINENASAHFLDLFRNNIDCLDEPAIRPITNNQAINYFLSNPDESIALCYTNKQAKILNDIIREARLIQQGIDPESVRPFEEDELVVFNNDRVQIVFDENDVRADYIQYKIGLASETRNLVPRFYHNWGEHTKSITYTSGVQFKIISVEEVVENVPYDTCPHQSGILLNSYCQRRGVSPEEVNKILRCNNCRLPGHSSKFVPIRFYKLTDEFGIEWFVPIDDEAKNKLRKVQKNDRDVINREAPGERNWNKFYAKLHKYNPTLTHRYASTVHKAQGLEWKYVFIDLHNINVCEYVLNRHSNYTIRDAKKQARQLAYTAVSRMRNEIIFI